MPSDRALKLAPWSTSKIQCALRCPLEFRYRYIDKVPEPQVSPEARLGKAVHKALEAALGGLQASMGPQALNDALDAGRKELLTDAEHERYAQFAEPVFRFTQRIAAFRSERRVRGQLLEHRVAVDADFRATSFFEKNVFLRGVWDAGFLFGNGILAVVDHKTGVRKPLADFADQLQAYAAMASAHVSNLRKVWLGVHFVSEGIMEWDEPVEPERVRTEFVPQVLAQIEQAAREVTEAEAPQTRRPYCTYCSYRALCPVTRGEVPRMTPLEAAPLPDLFERLAQLNATAPAA